MKKIRDLLNQEPARVFLFVRALAYLIAALFIGSSADEVDAFLVKVSPFFALFGVDLVLTQQTRARVFSSSSVESIVAGSSFASEIPSIAMDVFESFIPKLKGGVTRAEAFAVVADIFMRFSGTAVGVNTRADITRAMHDALRKAGFLKGASNWPPASMLFVFVAVMMLTSCDLVGRFVVDSGNELTGDQAVFDYTPDGVLFQPNGDVFGLVLDLQADRLLVVSLPDECSSSELVVRCIWPAGEPVSDLVQLKLYYDNLTGFANYTRVPAGRVFQEVLAF